MHFPDVKSGGDGNVDMKKRSWRVGVMWTPTGQARDTEIHNMRLYEAPHVLRCFER